MSSEARKNAAYRLLVQGFQAVNPAYQLTINEMIVEGEKIAAQWTWTARGPRMEVFSGVSILDFVNDQIARHFIQSNLPFEMLSRFPGKPTTPPPPPPPLEHR